MISGFLSPGSNFNYLAGDMSNYINFSFSVSWEGARLVQGLCNGPNILEAYISVKFPVGTVFSCAVYPFKWKNTDLLKNTYAISLEMRIHMILKVIYMFNITNKN